MVTEPRALASGQSDAALVKRARDAQDPTAFRALYDRYRGEIHAFLSKLLGDPARGEDVLQDAFTRVYLNLDRFSGGRPFRPWLYRIARNAALDALRVEGKEKRIAVTLADRTRASSDGTLPEVHRREGVGRMQAALASLSAESRALLIQRHGLCMKLEELAQSFDCTERTVRNRLRRAAAELATALIQVRGGDA